MAQPTDEQRQELANEQRQELEALLTTRSEEFEVVERMAAMITGDTMTEVRANPDKYASALDDLKIVDVARKPAGLSQDLKAGTDFLNSRETLIDLEDAIDDVIRDAGILGRQKQFRAVDAAVGRIVKHSTLGLCHLPPFVVRRQSPSRAQQAARLGSRRPCVQACATLLWPVWGLQLQPLPCSLLDCDLDHL